MEKDDFSFIKYIGQYFPFIVYWQYSYDGVLTYTNSHFDYLQNIFLNKDVFDIIKNENNLVHFTNENKYSWIGFKLLNVSTNKTYIYIIGPFLMADEVKKINISHQSFQYYTTHSILDGYAIVIYNLLTHTDVIPSIQYISSNFDHQYSWPVRICLELINRNIHSKITVKSLTNQTHYSESYIEKLFSKQLNMTVKQYIMIKKIKLALKHLIVTHDSIKSISYNLGFNSLSNFERIFKSYIKKTPKQLRELYQIKTGIR